MAPTLNITEDPKSCQEAPDCGASFCFRTWKGDRWTRVVRFYPRRRVLVEYQGRVISTMLWYSNRDPLESQKAAGP